MYPLSKSILDLSILLKTDRMIGTEDWLNSTILKKEQLAVKIQPNRQRILIVSGSNGLFGISAEKISQATGIETINLSSHAGLGGEYILNRAAKIIRKGDLILLPIEYSLYYSSGISDDFEDRASTLNSFMISYDRESLQQISSLALLRFLLRNAFQDIRTPEYQSYFRGRLSRQDISARLQQQKDRKDDNCYSGLTINNFGDETCNVGRDNIQINPKVLEPVLSSATNTEQIDPKGYISKFVTATNRIGAKIIPLYPVSTHSKHSEAIAFKKCTQEIKNFWKERKIEFRDTLQDALLAPELMYNTPYHPKDTGRHQRTQKIIKLVERNLNNI
ncbi:hypothetical protein C7B77_27085 [Chamaesiphon polymorphus CCALA 037]|uniref:Uncharacterized protein n=2 Tax=Chamaesiphon TaxID=217161 RepID=A0A2T1FA40_9CYAN|nr:hypothetical protein C7B77_27085 [Chamaesiphon polymorphus CCALA 037]